MEPNLKKLAKCYYIDWLAYKDEGGQFATLIGNIEKYFFKILFLSIVIWMVSFIDNELHTTNQKRKDKHYSEYQVFNDYGEFNSDQFSEFIKNKECYNENFYLIGKSKNNALLIVNKFFEDVLPKNIKMNLIELKTNIINHNTVVIKCGGK